MFTGIWCYSSIFWYFYAYNNKIKELYHFCDVFFCYIFVRNNIIEKGEKTYAQFIIILFLIHIYFIVDVDAVEISILQWKYYIENAVYTFIYF